MTADPYGWEPSNTVDFLGTENANGEPSLTFQHRRGRCYELAGWAVLFGGTAPPNTLLVHGSWTGPIPKERIGHAWLLLPGGAQVWEPIRARLYDRDEFYAWTKAWDEVSYSVAHARRMVTAHEHFGRWHTSRYP